MKRVLAALILAPALLSAQYTIGTATTANRGGGATSAITLDASCTGGTTSGAQVQACSSAMTVPAGDDITCEGFGEDYDPVSLFFNDPINGIYDNIHGALQPSNSKTWVATATYCNSAGGSITPQVNDWEEAGIGIGLACQAWGHTRTTKCLDGGGINLFTSTTAANPTAGTAASPTNANEAVLCQLTLPSAQTTSAGSGFSPTGTLTADSDSLAQYFEYQIQTAATAANCPFTSVSAKYTDSQFALLNTASPAGYRSLTGFYGVPAIAKTNGASVTAADLNGATTTLSTLNANQGWSEIYAGAKATYSTAVSPTGTGGVLVNGAAHTFGNAGTSIEFTNTGSAATGFEWTDNQLDQGEPMWFSYFSRTASSGISSGQECDDIEVGPTVTVDGLTVQLWYDSTNNLYVKFEDNLNNNASPFLYFSGVLDTDYFYQIHIAGASERYHQILVYAKSGGTWSPISTLNFDVLCAGTTGDIPCTGTTGSSPIPTAASGTGTASLGSTSLTISSLVSGKIAVGNVVDNGGAGIPYLTVVAAVSGSGPYAVKLSQATTAAVSGTVNFFPAPATSGNGDLIAATNGTAPAGSKTLTILAPGSGTIEAGDAVGAASGIAQGTTVTAVAGTSITLSQPTSAAMNSTGVWFWAPATTSKFVLFGKWSSCSIASPQYYSGLMYDPFGTWGAYAPN